MSELMNESQIQEMPKQVYRQKKKKLPRTFINILHDPRVVRGNTYAAFVIPTSIQAEFMRIKDEEDRKVRMMAMPVRLPRVALLNKKKDDYFAEDEVYTEEDTEVYKPLQEPAVLEDRYYFYEDRPPTPKYVPLPPGVEIETQIYPGDLFDFNTEVECILEVLVGRAMLDAKYEIIEEFERKEKLDWRRQNERKLEVEVVRLQKDEAAYIRRYEEKNRRQIQQQERKRYDIMLQKKLFVLNMSKTVLRGFNNSVIRQFCEIGVFKDKLLIYFTDYINHEFHPLIENCLKQETDFSKIGPNLKNKTESLLISQHKTVMDKVRDNRRKIQEEKDAAIRDAEDRERQKQEDTKNRREWKRIERIKSNPH